MNPDYLMLLFTDPMGKKMLVGGVVIAVTRRPGDPQNRKHPSVGQTVSLSSLTAQLSEYVELP